MGNRKIASITPLQMQEQANEWSRKLVYGRKLKGLMNNVFKYAIRHGYIETNPVDRQERNQMAKATFTTKMNFKSS